jgi:hypothetical protein
MVTRILRIDYVFNLVTILVSVLLFSKELIAFYIL